MLKTKKIDNWLDFILIKHLRYVGQFGISGTFRQKKKNNPVIQKTAFFFFFKRNRI